MRLLLHWLGMDNGSGRLYLFYSGFGANFGELLIFGGLISMYRKHNCHVKGCWRIGHRTVAGTDHVVCRRHHPLDAPTADQVADDHRAAWQ